MSEDEMKMILSAADELADMIFAEENEIEVEEIPVFIAEMKEEEENG